MYSLVNALQYNSGEWSYKDISSSSVTEVLASSINTLMTIKDNLNKLFYVDNLDLELVTDKSVSIIKWLSLTTTTFKELSEEIELQSSNYADIEGIEKVGNDYLVEGKIPFIITSDGISVVLNGVVKNIHRTLTSSGNFNIGQFSVDLNYHIHQYLPTEISTSIFKLAKKFKLNNTMMLFGDSMIKVSNIFIDDGDSFRLNNTYSKWLIDLYVDNIFKLSPNTIGLSVYGINKDTLISNDIMCKLFTHSNVYFVEYLNDLPLGETRIDVVDEYIDDYYDSLIMYNHRPTTNKVLHLRNRYMVRDILGVSCLRNYNDNTTISLLSEDRVLTKQAAYLYSLEWPKITYKL